MKFHEILPGKLYQRGLTDEHAIPDLERLGVVAVACMVKAPSPGVREWLETSGRNYYYLPIPDGKMTKPVLLGELAVELAANLKRGAVVTHCRAGRNRSALVSALVVREYLGVTGLEAMRIVAEARPRALANEHFRQYLGALPAPGKLSTTTTEVAT